MNKYELERENESLQARVAELTEVLREIVNGGVDASMKVRLRKIVGNDKEMV